MSSGYPSPSFSTVSSPGSLHLTHSSSSSTTPSSPASSFSSPSSPYINSPTGSFSPYHEDFLLYGEPASPSPHYFHSPPTSQPRSSPTVSSPTSAPQYSPTSAAGMGMMPAPGTQGYTELMARSTVDEQGEIWVTKDGKQVRYSSMHMNCATM